MTQREAGRQSRRGATQSMRLDHVGIVVDDLDEAKRFLAEVLGLELVNEVTVEAAKVRAAYFRCGDAEIELLELSDETARNARLGVGVRANIEHIAVEVEALESALVGLAASGVATTSPQPIFGGSGVWTDPTTTQGVLLQIIQKEKAGGH
jgi:methylmalonyl-CoA/ethylmalonyl-CoA epimerase